MALPLTGRYPVLLDKQGRIGVPAKVREAVGIGKDEEAHWFLSPGDEEGCLTLWPQAVFENLAGKLPDAMLPGAEQSRFERWYFSKTHQLRMDKQGRVVLPEDARTQASIAEELVLVGRRDRLQIWPKARWEEEEARMDRECEQLREIGRKVLA